MINISKWYKPLKTDLNKHLCDVELGLYLLNALVPNASADSLWVLLTGYAYNFAECQNWTNNHYQMLASARHLLPQYHSPANWEEALQRYQECTPDIRGYEIYQVDEYWRYQLRTNITVANNRFEIYNSALNLPVELSQRSDIQWAKAGKYKCDVNDKKETVEIIPEIASLPKPPQHNLAGVQHRNPLKVSWKELRKTAEWMDNQLEKRGHQPQWIRRFNQVKLQIFNDKQELIDAEYLTIDKILHLVGMVSSGKSNLMKILAVWGWQNKLRVTLVVTDVLQIFELTKMFDELGINDVAPILGNSNKVSHLNRLHRAVYNSNPNQPFKQEHTGFQWLSNTCLLTSFVHPKMNTQFAMGTQPCFSLETIDTNEEESASIKTKVCPAYGVCPYHKKERDLVNASILIATPGSLVYTRVPRAINRESILYFELVCRRSDLVIVDEVDQHQAYLDKAFSPDKTLRRPARDAWLDKLYDNIEAKLKYEKSRLLDNEIVSNWWNACQKAKVTADDIYHLLSKENSLSKWREKKNYFTDWLLLGEVANLLTTSDNTKNIEQFNNLMQRVFEPYIKDLDNEHNPLFALAKKDKKRAAIKEWVEKTATVELPQEKLAEIAVTLEFALLVCDLQNKLYFLMNKWQQVQSTLNLDISDSMWFDSPPSDFNPIIPAMPMGNQLAFQYHKSYNESLGSLQFFRCTGVGRWLLLNFDELFKGDNIASPHLLLMSGTSYAGKSPAYHVDVPVSGVLVPDTSQQIKIHSEFLKFSHKQLPISVSGAGDNKRRNLKEIVKELVEKEYLSQKIKELQGRKILLVVNSYEQVDWVYQCLVNLVEWKDKVIPLSPDDEIPDEWDDNRNFLQRGQSPDFATRPEVILIVPLKAIERGHNIVDRDGKAVIGAAYFLVLPHPIPDDLSYAIHSINRWAIDNYKKAKGENLNKLGKNFRDAAYEQWRHFLHLSVRLTTLPDDDRNAVYWDIIVSLWQVIGRLIRGNANAQVFWCDAKFGINTAKNEDGKEDTSASSVLVGIVYLLRPYFENDPEIPIRDRIIVQSLYRPFYQAIANTINLSGLPQINL
jgi:hypothetical protein